MLKVSGAGSKKKDLFAEASMLAVNDLITGTNPHQGFAAKYFNGIKLNLPSFFPFTSPPSIGHRQVDNPCLTLRENDWETIIKSTSSLSHTFSIIYLDTHVDSESKKSFATSP